MLKVSERSYRLRDLGLKERVVGWNLAGVAFSW